jgi:replicative DNA helicase
MAKSLPHHHEAEQSVLGSIFLDPQTDCRCHRSIE